MTVKCKVCEFWEARRANDALDWVYSEHVKTHYAELEETRPEQPDASDILKKPPRRRPKKVRGKP